MRSNPSRLRPILVAALTAWAACTAAQAAPARDNSPDRALEARVNALSAELRCLVCQNQSLADSHADLAMDLKRQVREQLAAGRSEAQVIDYMTQRYGDFVLYRPPFKATTLLLWLGPALLVALAALALWRGHARGNMGGRAGAQDESLAADDAARADALLDAAATPPPAPEGGAPRRRP